MNATRPIAQTPRPRRAPEPRQLAWFGILSIALATALATYADLVSGLQVNGAHIASDFIVFWTAAQAAAPYDFEALTAAQHWYMQTDTLRPFAYPPSFIPWVAPLTALPMGQAYLVWTVSTAALFALVWSRLIGLGRALAALAAPVVVFAMVSGQMVLLLGAMIVGGLALAEKRPLLAGILLGLAATVKPQALLLVPFALAASGCWRALLSAVVAGASVGSLCLLVQGTALWADWLAALPRFMQVIDDSGMIHYGITPASAMAGSGLGFAAATAMTAICALFGLLAVCLVFRRSADLRLRLLALVSGTLLVLPYAMPYELAVAAPAALSLLLDRRRAPFVWFAAFVFLMAVGQVLGLLTVAATVAWVAYRDSLRFGAQVSGEPQSALGGRSFDKTHPITMEA